MKRLILVKFCMFLDFINVPKNIAYHLLGENHSHWHRKIVGASLIGGCAYGLELASAIHISIIQVVCKIVEGIIFAIGATPYVEPIVKKAADKAKDKEDSKVKIMQSESDIVEI